MLIMHLLIPLQQRRTSSVGVAVAMWEVMICLNTILGLTVEFGLTMAQTAGRYHVIGTHCGNGQGKSC